MAKKTTLKKKKTTSKATKKSTKKGKRIVAKKLSTTKRATKAVSKKKAATKASVKKTTTKKAPAKKVIVKSTTVKKAAEKKTSAPSAKVKTSRSVVKKPKEVLKEEFIVTAESRAAAIKKIKGYSKKDLDHFKNIIIEKREEILEDLQSLKEQMLDPTTGEYINENSPYSLHMAEQGTDAMEREKTFLYAQRENKFLGYLDDALKRIENGIYGICIECIDEPQKLCDTCPLIPKARLEAVPHTQHCLPIKQRKSGH